MSVFDQFLSLSNLVSFFLLHLLLLSGSLSPAFVWLLPPLVSFSSVTTLTDFVDNSSFITSLICKSPSASLFLVSCTVASANFVSGNSDSLLLPKTDVNPL